jgi:hypothetical protein
MSLEHLFDSELECSRGELVCPMNPILAITTDDGAEVRVEGRGKTRKQERARYRATSRRSRRFDGRANGTRRCRAACARERRHRA